ncbi:MAG: signal peptidase I [Myxococcota bacterium]
MRIALGTVGMLGTVVALQAVGCGPPKVVPERDVDLCQGARWQTMPGDGMAPTVVSGDALAWIRFDTQRPPRAGDIVLFRTGEGPDDIHVSRAVGIGPTKVSFVDHLLMSNDVGALEHGEDSDGCYGVDMGAKCTVFVEAQPSDPPQRWRVQRQSGSEDDNRQSLGTWPVPAEHVFVAGDNRAVSQDSRAGAAGQGRPLPLTALLGRVVAVQRDGRCMPLAGT